MSLLNFLSNISPFRAMPTDDKGSASSVVDISGETVQLYYYTAAGVLTTDAGQAAGTLVVGKLAYDNVKNGLGSMEATFNDNSLSFTSNDLTTEKFVEFTRIEMVDSTTGMNRLAAIADGFANGEWTLDAATGTVYGKKASTGTTLTSAAYKIQSGVSTGGSALSTEIEGNVAHDAVESGNPIAIGGIARAAQQAAVAVGDRVRAVFNQFGELAIAGYTWATNSIRMEEIDPLSSHFVLETKTHTNVANATPEFGYISMNGFIGCTIHVEKTGGADTFDVDYEASNEGAEASDDWIDITANGIQLVGGGNYQSDHLASLDIDVTPVGLRYEITTAGAADDADFSVFIKKFYR